MNGGYFDRSQMQWYPNDEVVRCDKCESKVSDIDELFEVNGGDLVCQDCITEYYECLHCGEIHHLDNVSDIESVCETCFIENYAKCPICGKNFDVNVNIHYNEQDNHLCDICFNELKHL